MTALSIDLIEVLSSVQPRKALNKDAIEDYAELYKQESCPLPPVRIFKEGERHILSRGFHRLAAAKKAGKSSIQCEIKDGGEFDAILDAVLDNDNLTCGVRLTRADKRKSINTLIDHPESKKWTQQQIADQIGCSKGLVRAVMEERKTPSNKPNAKIASSPKEGDSSLNKRKGVKGGLKAQQEDPWDNIALGLSDKIEEIGAGEAEVRRLSEKNMDQQRDIVKLVDGKRIKTIGQALAEFEGDTVTPRDDKKEIVPEHLINVMVDTWFSDTEKALAKIATELKTKAQKNPYWKAALAEVVGNLEDYSRWIGDCQPSVVCPVCKGHGKLVDGKSCGWCRDSGWMPAWAYNDWKSKSKVKK